VITVRQSLTAGMVSLVALLAALGTTVEMGLSAWAVGLACGALVSLAVARGVVGAGARALGPADLITLSRATLGCAIAAVVAHAYPDGSARRTLVVLAVVALLLDATDGLVARRTGTSSTFGARFDGEADAFLLMVLSVYVAPAVGWWVLAIGGARYAFGAAGWVLPWMCRQLPPRYWRKVVAAVQGVVLTWAAAEVAPPTVVAFGLALALALLGESFGRDVLWLWSRRAAPVPLAGGQVSFDREDPIGAALSGQHP
jgi:phosphatidylglycerophosphate synthase